MPPPVRSAILPDGAVFNRFVGHPVADMLRTLLTVRWLIFGLLAALTFKAGVAPSFSWIAKEGVSAVQQAGATVASVVAAVGLPFLLVALAGGLSEFAERFASKAVEQRLIIVLQRTYLERRTAESAARDVTQVLYGCELAKKGFEVLYKDAWRLTADIGAIILWQLSIGPEWLPALVLSIFPALLVVWLVGPGIQRLSRQALTAHRIMAGRTRSLHKRRFEQSQERLFRAVMYLEVLRWLADRGMGAVLWGSFGLIVGASLLFDLGMIPAGGDVASASSFAVNLALLARPLGDIGKVYAKWREAMPAVAPVYGRH